MIYLDTRTRLRVSVMFMGQYDYHSQIYNHFNHERHLQNRQTYKQKRSQRSQGVVPNLRFIDLC